MFSDKLKDIEYYYNNKKKFNKLYNKVWKRIAGPKYIGLCSYLFQKFFEEWKKTNTDNPTIYDFAEYYFSHTNPVKSIDIERTDSLYYGRSPEELWRLAEHYQKQCNDFTIPLENYYDDIVNHAIIETFDGQIREINLIREYERKGFTVEHTYGKWDKDLGVDFIIRKNGIIRDYIQCKPITTFLFTKNNSLIEDRKNFFLKETHKRSECKKLGWPYYPTKFIIYNNDYPDKWCSINGKRGFFLEELIDKYGNNLMNKEDFSYV